MRVCVVCLRACLVVLCLWFVYVRMVCLVRVLCVCACLCEW